MKSLLTSAAVALTFAVSPLALAQTTSNPSPLTVSPLATGAQWYSHKNDQARATNLIGSKVKNEANETVGTINELILDKDKISAVVIGVGGFLGMGEREVAVNYDALKLSYDSNRNLVIMMNATKDALKAAPAWTWNDDRVPARQPVSK